MKAKLFAITIFAAVDAYFAGFALGFNSRHALIADPSIPKPIVEVRKEEPKPTPAIAPAAKDDKAAKAGDKGAAVPAKKGDSAKGDESKKNGDTKSKKADSKSKKADNSKSKKAAAKSKAAAGKAKGGAADKKAK